MRRVIVGQDRVLERVLVALLANGHCLLEGVPGLGKTLTVSHAGQDAERDASPASSSRPTCIPSDLVGTRIYRPSTERFDVELGPVFANFVLADEINRAPAKVQSRAARGHGRAPGLPRRRDVPGAVAVPGARHPEPDRVRGRLPAARGAAGPLPDAHPGRLPDAVGGARDRRPVLAPGGRAGPPAQPRATSPGCSGPPPPSASTRPVGDYAVRIVLATRRPTEHGLAKHRRAAGLRRQPPGQHRPRPGRPRPRPPPGPGPRRCRRTSTTSPSTC